MSFTVNDRVVVGGKGFDLQVEERNGYIVGEIFFEGRVLKRIAKKVSSDVSEKEQVLELYRNMKAALLAKLSGKVSRKSAISGFDEEAFKKKLLEYLQVEEDNFKQFFIDYEKFSVFISSDAKLSDFDIRDWFEQLLSVDSDVITGAFSYIFSFTLNGEDYVLIFLKGRKSAFKLGILVSGVRMPVIRANLRKNLKAILSDIEAFQETKLR